MRAAIFGGRLLLPVLRPFLPRARLLHFARLRRPPRAPRLCGSSICSARSSSNAPASKASDWCACFTEFAERSLGIFFGLFSVWLVVVAIRSLGAIADAEIHAAASTHSIRPRRCTAVRNTSTDPARDSRVAREVEELDRTGIVRRSSQERWTSCRPKTYQTPGQSRGNRFQTRKARNVSSPIPERKSWPKIRRSSPCGMTRKSSI